MEIDTSTATSRRSQTRQSAALEKTLPPRSGPFAQVLKGVESSNARTSIPPASATLNRLTQPRSSVFMQNMGLAQRRSAVEEKGFSARRAALERVSASVTAQAARSKEAHPSNFQLLTQVQPNTGYRISPSGFDSERSNGKAQKEQMLDKAKIGPNPVKNIIDHLMKNTLTFELIDIADYPIIRYAVTGEPVTKESTTYFSTTLTSLLEQRKQLYAVEKSRQTSDMNILEKLLSLNNQLPDRFKKMANW
ncbi:hypothetical protein V2K56_03910 [Pseudomonas alliivorans]|nr:hypothetical protein [Pseudomonas alliivorans]